ncbi:hypothetical protein I551_2029 [Mycobacterium ulcerans str. Harvey]|uniref:Uncharacterized protein n=1 Tax=Mycobacterium ulcerans str. Harvey TaxID=1299332 RepID=A0ABN0R3H2_MYCUL|nr:hypothetical protein I551_2029 [Mycobacterium ulcerans str. Harvey]
MVGQLDQNAVVGAVQVIHVTLSSRRATDRYTWESSATY